MSTRDDTRTATADQDGHTGRTADQVARAATAAADRLAGLAVADVMSLATRAADRAARTYRLAKYGQDATDVYGQVLADMLADVAAGSFPNVADVYGRTDRDQLAAVLAVRARRVADGYRRLAVREAPTGTGADVVDGPADTVDQETATASANRQIRAVLARVPRNLAAERSDVLAVAKWSRENMRAAETVLLAGQDRAAVLAAVDSGTWQPGTATQRAAWREMVDQHGQDVPTVAYRVGRVPVPRVNVAAVPDVDRAGRAALRAAERAAERAAVAAPTVARRYWPEVVAVALVAAARDRAREARAARDAVLTHAGRAARLAVDWQPVTVDRPAPAPTVADVLAGGYVPEILAERASTNRPRGSVDTYRSVSWSDVLPTSTKTARTQLAKAARSYVDHVNGQRVHALTDTNGQTIYVAPLVPVAVHVDVLPATSTATATATATAAAAATAARSTCWHGPCRARALADTATAARIAAAATTTATTTATTYQSTRMLAGRRVTVETRAGGAAARAAAARGRAARARSVDRDRLADRLAEILPVPVPTVPVVTSTGVVPVPAEPTTPRPYGRASYVVGPTGETVTAAAARRADWSAEWSARADQVAADVAAWLVDRSAAAADRDRLAGLVAIDRADRARHGYPVRVTGQDLRAAVAVAARAMVADW